MSAAPGTASRKLVLLLADAGDDSRESLVDALKMAGYGIISAKSTQSALTVLSQLRPHLLLLDLTEKPRSGWELLAELGASTRLASVPIVILSEHSEYESSNVADVLRKPVDLDELLSVVERHCL
jgi:DNA-binding response OmpR family regulator